MYDWQCCESKEGIKDSYTQIYQTQNCILKAKEGIKVGTGWASEGNEGWLWSTPKIRQPNSVYLMRERRSKRELKCDGCMLKMKHRSSSFDVLENQVNNFYGSDWELCLGGVNIWKQKPWSRSTYSTFSVPKTKLTEERKNTGNIDEPQQEKKKRKYSRKICTLCNYSGQNDSVE